MSRIRSMLAVTAMALTSAVSTAQAHTPATRVATIKVHSASIEGNLEGNSADREVFVVMPPSYATQPKRRYPVVYFLHGFFATAKNYMDGTKIAEGAAAAVKAGGQEMILVVPDSYTRHAGSLYSSSPTVGDFEGFITRDLVAYVDRHYRTLARPESRGLAGHSMGGYGTLRLAMKYPGIYSNIYAMSACCLAPRAPVVEQLRPLADITLEQAATGDFMVRATLSSAAAWSPAPEKPPLFLETGLKTDGTIDPLVTAKWAANAPLVMVAQSVPALKSLRAIAMDVGDKDPLLGSNEAVRDELRRYGLQVQWEIYDGDHGNRIADRFQAKVLPFFSRQLKPQ